MGQTLTHTSLHNVDARRTLRGRKKQRMRERREGRAMESVTCLGDVRGGNAVATRSEPGLACLPAETTSRVRTTQGNPRQAHHFERTPRSPGTRVSGVTAQGPRVGDEEKGGYRAAPRNGSGISSGGAVGVCHSKRTTPSVHCSPASPTLEDSSQNTVGGYSLTRVACGQPPAVEEPAGSVARDGGRICRDEGAKGRGCRLTHRRVGEPLPNRTVESHGIRAGHVVSARADGNRHALADTFLRLAVKRGAGLRGGDGGGGAQDEGMQGERTRHIRVGGAFVQRLCFVLIKICINKTCHLKVETGQPRDQKSF